MPLPNGSSWEMFSRPSGEEWLHFGSTDPWLVLLILGLYSLHDRPCVALGVLALVVVWPESMSTLTFIKFIKTKLMTIPRDEKGLVLLEHTTGKMRSNKFGKWYPSWESPKKSDQSSAWIFIYARDDVRVWQGFPKGLARSLSVVQTMINVRISPLEQNQTMHASPLYRTK